jgi:hypothetical protein
MPANPWKCGYDAESCRLTDKFVLNYKKVWPSEERDDSASEKRSSARRRSYILDHRAKDSLEEYREKLGE